MKKIIVAALMGALIGVSAMALAHPKHPNLAAAHELVVKAIEKIDAAQKANDFDMAGHAAKAKDLLTQAEGELKQAAEEANENEKKH